MYIAQFDIGRILCYDPYLIQETNMQTFRIKSIR